MGTLYIVSTPIGNLEDITIRAIKTLFSVDTIACEDTRRTGLLINELSHRYSSIIRIIEPKLQDIISYYDEVEDKRIPELIEALTNGKNVAVVSDAGTPLLSDPGFRLVRECVKRNIPVISIPGASAFLTALTSSGLPTNSVMFLGYPPEKQSQRLTLFKNILQIHRCISSTYIFYCAPHKLQQTLVDMGEVFGDIQITIAKELTKIHESVWHGSLTAASTELSQPKGEFVVLFNIPQA